MLPSKPTGICAQICHQVIVTHAVRDLQSKTRKFVEAHCHDLEAKIEYNQAETRHTTNETKVAVDKLTAQLTQLAT